MRGSSNHRLRGRQRDKNNNNIRGINGCETGGCRWRLRLFSLYFLSLVERFLLDGINTSQCLWSLGGFTLQIFSWVKFRLGMNFSYFFSLPGPGSWRRFWGFSSSCPAISFTHRLFLKVLIGQSDPLLLQLGNFLINPILYSNLNGLG